MNGDRERSRSTGLFPSPNRKPLFRVKSSEVRQFTAFKQTTHLIDGTWAVEYTSPLEALEGEPVFKKYCHDCFTHTGLAEYLTNRHMTAPDWTMIVVAVALHVCVNHAVLGFSVRNYQTVLPLDRVARREGQERLPHCGGMDIRRMRTILPFQLQTKFGLRNQQSSWRNNGQLTLRL